MEINLVTKYTDALARAAISTTVTGLTYTAATGVLSLTAGYVIPTTTQETNWGTAYTKSHDRAHGLLTVADHSDVATYLNQALLTTSTPQFLRLGIGVAADASVSLKIAASAANAMQTIDCYGATDALASILYMRKSGSDTIGTLAETASAEGLGYLFSQGVNSSSARADGAVIFFGQDGAAGATYIPSKIDFYTGTAAAGVAKRMTIDNTGLVTCAAGANIVGTVTATTGHIAPTGTYVGMAADKGRLLFTDAATDLITVKSADLIVDAGQKLGVGAAPTYDIHLQKAANYPEVMFNCFSDTPAQCAYMYFCKSNSDTLGTFAHTHNGDMLGYLWFAGVKSDDSAYAFGAAIKVSALGDTGSTYCGARIDFQTGTNAAAVATRLTILDIGQIVCGAPDTADDTPKLRVWIATAGTVDSVAGSIATFESNDSHYISQLSPADKYVGLIAGTPADNDMNKLLAWNSATAGERHWGITADAVKIAAFHKDGFTVDTDGVGAIGAISNGVANIIQNSTTGARVCAHLKQDDIDYAFMNFIGNEASGISSISTTAAAGFTYAKAIQIKINDTSYYLFAYLAS